MPSFCTKIIVLLFVSFSLWTSPASQAIPIDELVQEDTVLNITPEPLAVAATPPETDSTTSNPTAKTNVTFPTKDVLLNWLNLLFVIGFMLLILAFIGIRRAKSRA